jgi:hypothetical protein
VTLNKYELQEFRGQVVQGHGSSNERKDNDSDADAAYGGSECSLFRKNKIINAKVNVKLRSHQHKHNEEGKA